MLQHHSVEAELSRLAAQAQATPMATPKALTPSQLAVLAAGLGRKHGVKVVFGGNGTASTDGQTVVMPLTSKENSWIVRGYLDHEVGHVRLTNLNTIPRESPLQKSLWNILEDVRIEKAMADLYPGMATNLRVLISQLRKTKAGVFELDPDAPPEAVITAYVSLVLRTLHLGQPEVADLALKTREQFLKTFGPELERDLFTLISDIETATSTEDVVAIVGRIVDLLQQRAKEKPPEPEPEPERQEDHQPQEAPQDAPEGPQGEPEPDMPGEDKGRENGDTGQPGSPESDGGDGQDGEADHGQGEQDEPQEDSGDSSQQESDGSGDSVEQDADVDGDGTDPASSPGNVNAEAGDVADSTGGGSVTVPDEDAPLPDPVREAVIQALESQDEQADLGEQLKALVQQREADLGLDPGTIRIARPTKQSTLPDFGYRKHQVSPSTSVVAKLSGKLRGLLQAQALDHAKPSAAGSRIARSRLHRIRTGESKLFLRNDQVRQVNTAIHLLVDNSGSMRSGDRFPITRDVCMALVKALSPIRGVNLGLTVFPAFYRSTTCDPATGVPATQVDPVLLHGQRPASALPWPPAARGGTPLAESLRYVLTEMVSLPEPRKIVIILTDGDPNDGESAVAAIREATDLKIEVMTLGIEDVRHPELFPRIELLKDVRELPEKAFRLLEGLLISQ
ncbi:MAG: VWA domain-containing protein [Desulfovibrionales bacterium]|nr:MAG: VWA domain-containing protein [Desulfovibrionales bacterium]